MKQAIWVIGLIVVVVVVVLLARGGKKEEAQGPGPGKGPAAANQVMSYQDLIGRLQGGMPVQALPGQGIQVDGWVTAVQESGGNYQVALSTTGPGAAANVQAAVMGAKVEGGAPKAGDHVTVTGVISNLDATNPTAPSVALSNAGLKPAAAAAAR